MELGTVRVVSDSIAIIVGGSAIITTVIIYIRARVKKAEADGAAQITQEAISSLKATVGALKEQNELQAQEMGVQSDKIEQLSGTVNTLKDIPLAKIEKHMEDTNTILKALLPLIPTSVERTVTEQTRVTQ